jgi:hypothetical protein
MSFLPTKAQTHLPVSGMNFTQWLPLPGYRPFADSSHSDQRWYLYKYAGISSGAGYYAGGSLTFMSIPIGIQLNHQLTNNLFAFAGMSTSPAFYYINQLYSGPYINKSYPGNNMSNTYGFGMNSRVEIGLMYINDAKTFSISGSIGIDRSIYPLYPSNRTNIKKK